MTVRFARDFGAALFACAVLGTTGCTEEAPLVDGVFTQAEWNVIQTLTPLGSPPPDPTNRYADDSAAATLGQKFFFEGGFSGAIRAEAANDGVNGGLGTEGETGRVSCAGCHVPSTWFMDTRSRPNTFSLGVGRTSTNAPSVVNAAYYDWFFASGTRDSLWSHALGPPEIASFMGSSRLELAHYLFEDYRAEYDALFTPPLDPALDAMAPDAARFPATGRPKARATDPDGPWEMMTDADRDIVNRIFVNYGKAIAAYQRLLVSRGSAFDRYVAGERGAMSAAAKRGLRLFIGKAACVACHSGPLFADNRFHNIGIPETADPPPEGRFAGITSVLGSAFNTSSTYSDDTGTGRLTGLMPAETDRGAFRTRGLRQIAETGPYMHTGAFATLTEVVEFYDRGGGAMGFAGTRDPLLVPLALSPQERADIVEFLGTLTGEQIPAALQVDTSSP